MSMTMIQGIEKLHNGNYYNWKVQVQMALIKEKVWGAMNGSTPRPSATTSKEKKSETVTKAMEEWQTMNNNALMMILLAVSDSQLSHIRSCKNAADMWKKLANIHEGKGLVR